MSYQRISNIKKVTVAMQCLYYINYFKIIVTLKELPPLFFLFEVVMKKNLKPAKHTCEQL